MTDLPVVISPHSCRFVKRTYTDTYLETPTTPGTAGTPSLTWSPTSTVSSLEELSPSTPSSIFRRQPVRKPSHDGLRVNGQDSKLLRFSNFFKSLRSKGSALRGELYKLRRGRNMFMWDKIEDPFVMEDTAPINQFDPFVSEQTWLEWAACSKDSLLLPDLSEVFSVNNSRQALCSKAALAAQPLEEPDEPSIQRQNPVFRLLDLDSQTQDYLAWWFMVGICGGKGLTPYEYTHSQRSTSRPIVEFLLALCGSQDSKKTRLVESARNFL